MKQDTPKRPLPSPSPYEPPRLVRVTVRTTRDHLGWQYAGQTTCTAHNHTSGQLGCEFPQ